MRLTDKSILIGLHRTRWTATLVWFGFLALFGVLELVLGWSYYAGHAWLCAALVLMVGFLMHAHLIAFHETAHRALCPNQLVNDLVGVFVGSLSFMSFTLYRVAHHSHHSYLAKERDEELWPFVLPGTPRWARCAAAFLELTCGLMYTPLLFLRTFLRKETPIRGEVRKLVWTELGLISGFWATTIVVSIWLGIWDYVLVLYLAPAVVSGNLQSLRKYIEHMGLTNSTVLGLTRSVIPRGPLGHLLAFSMFNIPYHGIHHKFARLPQDKMPLLTEELAPRHAGDLAPFPSYRSAFWDMVKTLADPRIGDQWHPQSEPDGAELRLDVPVMT